MKEQTATLEKTMHDIDISQASWLKRPDAELPMRKLESRIIIDSRHVGGFIGIKDLNVEAPAEDTNDSTGGTTESGISGSKGLVFTGTPKDAGFDQRVSVTVDVSIVGPDPTTMAFTPTAVVTGPNTADTAVPDAQRAAGLRPTSFGARGSDVIIEGITDNVSVTLEGFRQP